MTEARRDIFLWISGAVKPGIPFSTMNPLISPSSVRAQTIAMSAIEPFVIHILAPFRTQSVPSRRAWVRIVPGVGAGVGLGQAETADHLARVHPRQPVLLLLLRAPLPDREHRERALDRDDAADPGVARLELEARQAVGDGAGAREAVAVQVHAEETELCELGDHLAREDALLEPVSDLGEDLLADELPHGVADRLLLLVEERVDREEVEGVESWRGGGRGHGKDLRESKRVTPKIYRKCARAEAPGSSGSGRTPPVACARDHDRDLEALASAVRR